jgi:hypothetical protein
MIRPFELRDIPILRRYRQRGLFLDSIPTLTWGRTLIPAGAMLSPLSSATGVFTSICTEDEGADETLIGQVVHANGSPYARFTFLAPDAAINSDALPALLESLIARVAKHGAQSLIAEVDENSHAFEALRKAGFSIYTRQRIWKMGAAPGGYGKASWRRNEELDEFAVRVLYNDLVPALVQQVEPAPWEKLRGYVHYVDNELRAYANFAHGPSGIWSQPFIHPEIENVPALLSGLIVELGPRPARPVYLCARSSQAWLEASLEELGAEVGPRQAVMVKRMAVTVKKPVLAPLPELQSRGTEATTPYMQPVKRIEQKKEGIF